MKWLGLSLLEGLTYCSSRLLNKHLRCELNFLTDESKFHEKVYVSNLFHVSVFLIMNI